MNESFKNLNRNDEPNKSISRRDFLKGAGTAIGILLSGAYSTGPEKNQVSLQKNIKKPETDTVATPYEIIAENINLSKIKKDFTPFPSCYGGECYEISFLAEFRLEKEKYVVVHFSFGGYVEKKGTSKTKKEVLEGNKLYKTLQNIDPKKVSVAFNEGKVTHISTDGKTLWESLED